MTISISQVSVTLSWRAAQAGDLADTEYYHLKKHCNSHLPLLDSSEIARSHLEAAVEAAAGDWGQENHWRKNGAGLLLPLREGILPAWCISTCFWWHSGNTRNTNPAACRTHQLNAHCISALLPLASAPLQQVSPVPAQPMNIGLNSVFIFGGSWTAELSPMGRRNPMVFSWTQGNCFVL